MSKEVIKVITTKENIVRDETKKKKNVIFALKEKVIPMKTKREI